MVNFRSDKNNGKPFGHSADIPIEILSKHLTQSQWGKILPEAQRGRGLIPCWPFPTHWWGTCLSPNSLNPVPLSRFSWLTNPYTKSFFCSFLILWMHCTTYQNPLGHVASEWIANATKIATKETLILGSSWGADKTSAECRIYLDRDIRETEREAPPYNKLSIIWSFIQCFWKC